MTTATGMQLSQLLPQVPQRLAALRVSGLCIDSRKVQAGDLFFARSGVQHRGADYIGQAALQGAVAAVVDEHELAEEAVQQFSIPVLRVAGLDAQLGYAASRFYGEPSREMRVIGITGTNGKTSCAHYLAQALNSCGLRAALIGTVGNGFPGLLREATHTTPDPISLQAELARLRAEGAQAVVMEVSSHALDQGRVAGVQFDAAAYTNLTHDHLDYHGDMAAYAKAKARLFTDYGAPLQVLNADDAEGRVLLAQPCPAGGERIGFSLHDSGVQVYVEHLTLRAQGLMFELHTPWGEVLVTAPLLGEFNVSNLLLVAALLGGLGFELSNIASALAQLEPVCGRMERLSAPGMPTVIVDYAHTPDALDKALQATRAHMEGSSRLWAVFGCGGDRDNAKRAVMGQIAAAGADEIVLTSDNPRSENPHSIIQMIQQGIPQGRAVHVEPDRAQAIAFAVAHAAPGDMVLVAGKGHETYQEVNGVRSAFSDQEHVRSALSVRASGEGAGG
ncbi:UDP-N-acetylmuramoyl-L-alanyl-D-glutamate--2,6-diaminopimelate ligase [Marinobacterium zhoushanense]|uniref:UDP-N-acetylmuramoyl-L-alanyl-D-glutamate--2,6-diaminopimelate ligase n=1 Tax=Marinobacterium zhoushanense TaxID=1679163 RepID=A0ABQ1K467_9GAMM|nr:UDP-N-acetylmuramoyl-L-alanyl-D-glutamate--2,6-diaminopimelate ligase [Marinobacterium zhoushanense]GGB87714.1 UDP-N-acetylmuramoyl-L-alanyl-D-glutamate--2,6-diaminopimelate ligase [Marinobacterium zhoushanense]